MSDKDHQKEQVGFVLQGLWLEFLTFLLPVGIGVVLLILTVNMLGIFSCSLALFVAGFSGLIVLVRKEIPTALGRIRRKRAVVEGIMLIVLFWGIAIFLLVEGMK